MIVASFPVLIRFVVLHIICWFSIISAKHSNSVQKPVVITLSFGRSGSDYITEVISNIFGVNGSNHLANEMFGSNTRLMSVERNHTEYMIDYIAGEMVKRRDSPVVGFKWKQGVMNEAYDEAWKYVAAQQWLVVHNTRNPLDVFISKRKHGEFSLRGHCSEEDKACLEKAENAIPYVNVTEAIAFVTTANLENARLDYFLRTLGVHLYEVRYEDLVYGSAEMKLKHLQGLADFLLYPNYKTVQLSMLNTDTVETSASSQADKVTNWKEVYHGFKDSPFAYLLRL